MNILTKQTFSAVSLQKWMIFDDNQRVYITKRLAFMTQSFKLKDQNMI